MHKIFILRNHVYLKKGIFPIIIIGKDLSMFSVFEEDFDSHDFLINVTDWISVTNESISYDEMLIMLDENGIKFSIKHSYEHQYVVIDKSCYSKLFALLVGNPSIRITRIDFKFDIFSPKYSLISSGCLDIYRNSINCSTIFRINL